MDKILYLTMLYETYKDMCTEKQKAYFEAYYYDNLSYGEISEINNVSRNAIHNQLKILEERLIEMEKTLKIIEKREKVLKMLKNKVSDDILSKVEEIL